MISAIFKLLADLHDIHFLMFTKWVISRNVSE